MPHTRSPSGLRRSGASATTPPARPARFLHPRRPLAPPPAASTGPSLLQKLGRVIQEKAQSDFDRLTKGASKTRDRLGVSWKGVRATGGR